MEAAYRDSYDKYTALQEDEGIWDGCMQPITAQIVWETIRRMKTSTATGRIGLTYDTLREMEVEHLRVQPIADLMQHCLDIGEVPNEMNRALMKPLPKTDEGLSNLSLTGPIVLMETVLKVYERILFERIVRVLEEH